MLQPQATRLRRNVHVDPLLTTPQNVRRCRHTEWLVALQALQRLKNASAYLIYGRSIFYTAPFSALKMFTALLFHIVLHE